MINDYIKTKQLNLNLPQLKTSCYRMEELVKRRFDTIDKLVNDYLEASNHAICDTDWETYWGEIENVVTSGFYWNEIVGTKYDKKGWEQSVDAILDILKVHYYPKIKELYDSECK